MRSAWLPASIRNEPGGNSPAGVANGRAGAAHRQVLQPVAQRDQAQRPGVLDGDDRPAALQRPDGDHVGGEQLGRRGQDRGVVHGPDVEVVGQAHRPGAVVVGAEVGVGIGLLLEQRPGQSAIWLVESDQIGAGGDLRLVRADLGGGAVHLDGLAPQQVHHPVDPRLVGLARRQDVGIRRRGAAGGNAVGRLAVEVLDQHRGDRRGQLQRGQDAGLRVVDRVADRPVDLAGRCRLGPIPLAGQLVPREPRLLGVGPALVEDFVHPQHAVVVGGGEAEVPGRPHVHETEVPHARHAVTGELVDLVGGEERQLRIEDRVEVGVLRRLPAEGVEQHLGLVEVVPHRRDPVQVPLQVGPQRVHAVVDVAVVVVEDVLAPVGRSAVVLAAVVGLVDLVGVVPVHRAIAPVEVGGRRHRDDQVVANLADVRLLRHGQPVDQLDHRLGRRGLGTVEAGGDVVMRLGGGHQRLGLSR